jgi:hypothetical protein
MSTSTANACQINRFAFELTILIVETMINPESLRLFGLSADLLNISA